MFKKKEYIIYPVLGASRIEKIYTEMINGAEKKYYQILFKTNNMEVSVPVEKAEELGLRYPLSKTKLQQLLKDLEKPRKLKDEEISNVAEVAKEKLSTGSVEDAVDLIRMLKTVQKKKIEANKVFELNDRDNLRSVINFLRSEVMIVLGEKTIKKYDLNSKSD